MAVEPRNRPNLTSVENVIDVLNTAKSNVESEHAGYELNKSQLIDSISRYAPNMNAPLASEDYSDRERNLLRSELDHHRTQYKKLMQQYDELYSYCEKLLADAETRRKDIAHQNERLASELSKASSDLQSQQFMAVDVEKQIRILARERDNFSDELETKKIELQALSEELRHENEAVKALNVQLKAISDQLSDAQEQEAWQKGQVQHLEAKVLSQQMSSQRALTWLTETTQILDSLCNSVIQHFDRIGAAGASALSPKAGKILAEQLRNEVMNLKRLEVILAETRKPPTAPVPPRHPGTTRTRDA
jgi:chromosome segregation ATPase